MKNRTQGKDSAHLAKFGKALMLGARLFECAGPLMVGR